MYGSVSLADLKIVNENFAIKSVTELNLSKGKYYLNT